MANQDLKGRLAVVTGGANGIGRSTARLLARQGAKVFVADLQPLPENTQEFFELGIVQQKCDVRCPDQLQQVIDAAVGDFGHIDILINNAGIGMVKQVSEVTENDWNMCLDTNLKAAFFASKYAIRHMRHSGGGAIVMNSSNAGLLPRSHDPVYSISKQALIGLTKSLALCHAADKIRVNAVCPGPVGDTGMMNADLVACDDPQALTQSLIDASPIARSLKRMIHPDEVAQAILYLVSDAAVMVTGTAIAIDGGKSLGIPPR